MANEDNLTREIRRWWADFPMTYGEDHGSTRFGNDGLDLGLGNLEFFEAADLKFKSWNMPLHVGGVPFSRIFPYSRYVGKDVLEVGCGLGFMASCWSEQGSRVTAVDLNPTSVAQTTQRFSLYSLDGNVLESDARSLPFSDSSFDYVYSWGVLHHSPDISTSIRELYRVLRPGGEFGVMLYNRNSLLYRLTVLWSEGVVNMENKFLEPLALASRYTDGARQRGNPHTWPVTKKEVRSELFRDFEDLSIEVLGTDLDYVMDTISPFSRRLLQRFRLMDSLSSTLGWSLWITGRK